MQYFKKGHLLCVLMTYSMVSADPASENPMGDCTIATTPQSAIAPKQFETRQFQTDFSSFLFPRNPYFLHGLQQPTGHNFAGYTGHKRQNTWDLSKHNPEALKNKESFKFSQPSINCNEVYSAIEEQNKQNQNIVDNAIKNLNGIYEQQIMEQKIRGVSI